MEIIARKTRYAEPVHNEYMFRLDVLMANDNQTDHIYLTLNPFPESGFESTESKYDFISKIRVIMSEGYTKNVKPPLISKFCEYFTFDMWED